MKKAKFIKEVTIADPETMSEIEVSIFKHENGNFFGLDNNFVDQLEETFEVTIDPFYVNETVSLIWK